MVSKRLNYCESIRLALEQMNVSHVRVIEAVNAVLGQAELHKAGELKAGRLSKATKTKESSYKVSESGSTWTLPVCIVTTFDTWAGKVADCEKVARFGAAVPIPTMFVAWLNKFSRATGKVSQAEPGHVEDFANSPE